MKFDFSGYATKNDLKCSDGRVIRHNAFKDNDGATVPLVWQHIHNDPANVLGHADLENRPDGVYARCYLNDTDAGQRARELVKHGDVNALSIYANQLVQNGSDVIHGNIREVSLVLSGANPGAMIDNVSLAHGDGTYGVSEEEAVIYTGTYLIHSDDDNKEEPVVNDEIRHEDGGEKTIQDVFNTLNEEQKKLLYFMVGQALEDAGKGGAGAEMAQSGLEGDDMSRNVFYGDGSDTEVTTLSHAEFSEIMADAKQGGSFREAFLSHAQEYGIENIEILFPDARTVTPTPDIISEKMDWVSKVLNGTHHSPFSRIKSTAADITADEARAKGYIKGNRKKEEVFKVMKRVTTPTTIYKKQKLDRDDIVDITDLDVVAFVRQEMRVKLNEEIARAIIVGDGRDADDEDKINEENLRPIASEDEFYAPRAQLTSDDAVEFEDLMLRQRNNYEGTGTPNLYIDPELVTALLLQRDKDGRRMYSSVSELATALRVGEIIEVPYLKVPAGASGKVVRAIMVNLKDYTVGADKGGEINMFDDFDIDYNQYKYLLETRISGCLTHPKSAIVFEYDMSGAGAADNGDAANDEP